MLNLQTGFVKIFQQSLPLSIRKEHSLEVRRGLSTFENMPFLRVEDALLGARKAFSPTHFVTY